MYVQPNFKTKSELKAAVAAGRKVTVFQAGGFYPAQENGVASVEGPHFPEPHRWYARVEVVDGCVVAVKR